MNIVIFGPPGAGKGTQADNLVKEYNLFKVSTGDLLRNEIQKKSTLGLKIKKTIDQGKLVSDKIIDSLVEEVLSNKKYFNKLIFDGYPRNLSQAQKLDDVILKNNQKIMCVLSLNVDKNTIIKRILGRLVCSKCDLIFNKYFNPSDKNNHSCDSKFLKKRSDDNEKTIENRHKIYINQTIPIINYYKNKNLLHEIDGMGDIAEIYKEIRQIMHSLDA